jgi:hypothetical protein
MQSHTLFARAVKAFIADRPGTIFDARQGVCATLCAVKPEIKESRLVVRWDAKNSGKRE